MKTATRTLNAKERAYRDVTLRNDRELTWIAGVLLDCSKPTTRLRGLLRLVDAGHEVRAAQFKMPYEAIVVDGCVVNALPVLDGGDPKENPCPYTADWWNHNRG